MPRVKSLSKSIESFFRRIWEFIYSFRKIFIIWAILAIFVIIGFAIGLDKKAIAFFAIIFGLISQAFLGLINLIALIAIKRGFSKDVINYRVLTIVFLVGIAVGFVIGKLI